MDTTRDQDAEGGVRVSPPKLGPLPPLTPEEQRRWFEVLEMLDQRRAEMLAARGGVLFPNAWEEFPDPGEEIYDEAPEESHDGEPA